MSKLAESIYTIDYMSSLLQDPLRGTQGAYILGDRRGDGRWVRICMQSVYIWTVFWIGPGAFVTCKYELHFTHIGYPSRVRTPQ